MRKSGLVGLLVALLALGPAVAAHHEPGWQLLAHDVLWEGVEFRIVQEPDPDPLRYHVLHVHPNAPVRFKPVVSNGRLGSGREVVSSMCARMGAIGCINASYPICPTCDLPHGAVIRKHQFLQSPTDHQYQLSLVGGRFRTGPIPWSARVEAGVGTEAQVLHLDGINSGVRRDKIVLHNRHFGPSTRSPEGTVELIVRAPTPLWVGGVRQPMVPVHLQTDGDAPIPRNGAVLSGSGVGGHVLWAYAHATARMPKELVVETPPGIELTVSGHPTLLVDGEPTPLDPIDLKVTRPHPRTLLGWDDEGAVWMVVVDGRQAHSRGLTLEESRQLLLELGARHAINLDGGGSSTMVSSCEIGWCVRNRPSDGRERRVWVGLALVPPGKW